MGFLSLRGNKHFPYMTNTLIIGKSFKKVKDLFTM